MSEHLEHLAVFSFYATKNLSIGRGGMLLTNEKGNFMKKQRFYHFMEWIKLRRTDMEKMDTEHYDVSK